MHSGWVSDHIAWPPHIESEYPYTDDGSFPAPPTCRGSTRSARCSSSPVHRAAQARITVLILGYRPPLLTAKAMASLDVLSEAGRCSASAWAG